ncbi:secreted RxLR effector protein 161-like [Nicotiana tomentosiformis]|uniref:secreted RxLR effector protein 161-like n=1 Tax=Nicotiana tomentosiformis TaxID=4098 RepID=UPI00388CDE16
MKKFNMHLSKSVDTLIAIATKLDLDEKGKSVEHKLYRGMIWSLLYVTTSRPDIVFSVGLCARFQANPKKSHMKAVKRILRYLRGAADLCLWYPRGYSFDLVGYADADYTGFHVDKESTSRTAHFLGSCLVSWGTKKQNSVALSTTKVEYLAATSFCAQLLWIKQHLRNYGIFVDCVPIFCDNTSAINIAKHSCQHKRTKHIDIRHHFLRDNVEKGNISINFYKTKDQIANIFTKALSRDYFERNKLELGLRNTSN